MSNEVKSHIRLEQKIQILESFDMEHGEEITGKTVYKGFPIEQWAS